FVQAQDASVAGIARTALEGVAVKGDPKALAAAIARRWGDWFDVVLSAVAEPMPPLEPTKALVAGLPDPEKKGVAAVLDAVAAAPAATGQAFAAAAPGLAGALRAFADPHTDPKNVVDAASSASSAERVKEANHEWIAARATIAKAIGSFDAGIAD